MSKKIIIVCVVICCCLFQHIHAQQKLRRAESFFGFHFDFHATAADKDLGKRFDTALLADFLRRTKPDYIQIDSKGHPGYSSYPTKVGYSANSFVQDPMRIWRDVTSRYNVPLYVHYSGIWDDKAIHENPQWGRIKADGTIDSAKAAYLGDYSTKLLIPQLKEMIDRYAIDGAWVDGDCWATAPDYSPAVVNGFLSELQVTEVPRKPTDSLYKQWLDYNRKVYRTYLKQYIDALHQYAPSFQVASNWSYSSMMPEKVATAVDFLSGDVSPSNSVYSSAFQARCLALQNKPWDLMAWSFMPVDFMGGIHSPKSLVHLQQEAAEVMAMGGGFQVYFQQNRDASFRTIDTDAMVQLAKFCRERQPFCQEAKVIPQIGLWYSLEGWKKRNEGVYGWASDMEGINNLLLDNGQSVEILMDHQLSEKMEQYPLIVIPEWDAFDEQLRHRLLTYVEKGGNLFIIGAAASRSFASLLHVRFEGTDSLKQLNIGGEKAGGISGLKTRWQKVISEQPAEIEGMVYAQCDYRYATDYPVATIQTHGKGKIAAMYMDISGAYNQYRNPVLNTLVNNMVKRLLPQQDLYVSGSEKVHVVLGKKDKKTLVHLINSGGDHANKNTMTYGELNPLPPLTVRYRTASKPASVKLQPAATPLKFTYANGYVQCIIPAVKVHAIVEISQ